MTISLNEKKNWLEWLVFGFSLVLTLSVIVFLAYLAITHKNSDPDLEVLFKPDQKQENKHVYHVTLKNSGNSTAERVKVALTSWKDGKEEEKAELEFPFSPKQSAKEGWVTFTKDPASLDSVSSRVVGYLKP